MKGIRLTALARLLLLCLAFIPNVILASAGNLSEPDQDSSSTKNPITCGRNEEHTVCASCPQTCKHIFPRICNRSKCEPGCRCRLGFYRNSKNECVSILGCMIDNILSQLPTESP